MDGAKSREKFKKWERKGSAAKAWKKKAESVFGEKESIDGKRFRSGREARKSVP